MGPASALETRRKADEGRFQSTGEGDESERLSQRLVKEAINQGDQRAAGVITFSIRFD